MSLSFYEHIKSAVRQGTLPEPFWPSDVRRACQGWAPNTYGTFLPKHRSGNPGGDTELFVRHADGSYSLLNRPSPKEER